MAEKCPYCGGEMVKGYIQCRDGVYWSEKIRPVAAIRPLDKSALALKNDQWSTSNSMLSGDAAEAYNCPECRKIIITYEGDWWGSGSKCNR